MHKLDSSKEPLHFERGDIVLRITGFFLIFSPAGAALSVDRLLRIWRQREHLAVPLAEPWAQRMIQFQIAVLYFATFYWKMMGNAWTSGGALYYALRIDELRRFPMPTVSSAGVLEMASWGTLIIESTFGVLVWFRPLRYTVLLLGVCLHLGIEYSMNIPLFEWIMLATYITFIYPSDLTKLWRIISERARARVRPTVYLYHDGSQTPIVELLQALDVFNLVRFERADRKEVSVQPSWPAFPSLRGLCTVTPSERRNGIAGIIAVSPFIPALWILAPLKLLSYSHACAEER